MSQSCLFEVAKNTFPLFLWPNRPKSSALGGNKLSFAYFRDRGHSFSSVIVPIEVALWTATKSIFSPEKLYPTTKSQKEKSAFETSNWRRKNGRKSIIAHAGEAKYECLTSHLIRTAPPIDTPRRCLAPQRITVTRKNPDCFDSVPVVGNFGLIIAKKHTGDHRFCCLGLSRTSTPHPVLGRFSPNRAHRTWSK